MVQDGGGGTDSKIVETAEHRNQRIGNTEGQRLALLNFSQENEGQHSNRG
jgi:hypothetical protein